ncbi:MAG: phosphoribosylamine--glycine ligase [Acidimicrobiales bacterium]
MSAAVPPRDPNQPRSVLLIGSGGREHAIANALLRSHQLDALHITPGNAGTAAHNVALDPGNHLEVVDYCVRHDIDLVVVGPEAPLVAGIADDLTLAGVACFGPSAEAAQLEGSKSFARDFASRHGIPGPVSRAFTEVDAALEWLEEVDFPVVVKADGLAAGKGVIVPEDRVETERAIFDLLADKTMGHAGDTIVLEERLVGEEISLFGVADGRTVIPLATAQDHKRVGEGNTGLNTGGMGAFAPVPGLGAELERQLADQFLTAAVRGMAAEGNPYVGVLYAGIMLTDDGPRLIEYNCRFGDPEAQAIIPLIETDLLDVLDAAAHGELESVELAMSTDTAVAVVVAAEGYPTSPRMGVTVPLVEPPLGVEVLQAATQWDGGRLVSCGGRVLSVVGVGPDLPAALAAAYPVVDRYTAAEGLFARSDIGWRHAPRAASKRSRGGQNGNEPGSYSKAGVSLTAAAAATKRIGPAVRSTHDERVLAGLGSFGGVLDLIEVTSMKEPLLVASTDGVGTKTEVARRVHRWRGVGADIVNHGINDVLVQGARPLAFLDTVAAAELDPEIVGEVVEGMAEACRAAGCVLLGGETAEMPGVLTAGSVDVSGTMIGLVERANLLPTGEIGPGHVLIGLASSGLHTNGYSLARQVFADHDWRDPMPGGSGESIADALLAVHRSYLEPLTPVLDAGLVDGLVHITGGGMIDNIPRVVPPSCGVAIDPSAWRRPVLFNYLIAQGGLSEFDAHRVFNCGIGMVVLVAPERVEEARGLIPEPTWIIGRVGIGRGDVTLV